MENGNKGTSVAQRIFSRPPHRGQLRLHKSSEYGFPLNAPWTKSNRIKPSQTLKKIFLFSELRFLCSLLLNLPEFVSIGVHLPRRNPLEAGPRLKWLSKIKNYQTNPFQKPPLSPANKGESHTLPSFSTCKNEPI